MEAVAEQRSIERYTDQEFIALVKEFDALQTEKEKVQAVWQHTAEGDGLLKPLNRVVQNKLYSFGFNVQNAHEAQAIATILHDILKYHKFSETKKAFAKDLQTCDGRHATVGFMEQKIQESKAAMEDLKETPWFQGYRFEKLRRTDLYSLYTVNLSDAMNDPHFFYSKVSSCADGATAYMMEAYFSDLLHAVQTGATLSVSADGVITCQVQASHARLKGNKDNELQPALVDYELKDFIEPEFCGLFERVEAIIKKEVLDWKEKKKGAVIDCAGFCEAIFQKKWFRNAKPGKYTVNNKDVRDFASWRFQIDLTNQLLSAKKQARERARDKYIKRSIW
jgi:hypothetical protein